MTTQIHPTASLIWNLTIQLFSASNIMLHSKHLSWKRCNQYRQADTSKFRSLESSQNDSEYGKPLKCRRLRLRPPAPEIP